MGSMSMKVMVKHVLQTSNMDRALQLKPLRVVGTLPASRKREANNQESPTKADSSSDDQGAGGEIKGRESRQGARDGAGTGGCFPSKRSDLATESEGWAKPSWISITTSLPLQIREDHFSPP